MRSKRLLLAVAMSAIASVAFAANRPNGYTTICNEGRTCSVPANTNVAFGRADHFFFKVLSGSFVCLEATFGGRITGGVNECSVPTGTGGGGGGSGSGSGSGSGGSPDLGFYP